MSNLKIMTIVGARPQFVKAAMISRAILNAAKGHARNITEIMVHTGQHYDYNMSEVFFEQLQIAKPSVHLGIGGGSHAAMTANMLIALEEQMRLLRPDVVVVYGDTNSTLAGALAASKLHLPVAHVEAGLRSFNMRMPEEINRKVTDHLSKWLYCPTRTAAHNLHAEGIKQGIEIVGDVMYDAAIYFAQNNKNNILDKLQVKSKKFFLATIHRQENTEDLSRLDSIISALVYLSKNVSDIVWPVHPRLKEYVSKLELPPSIIVTEPLSFFDIQTLLKSARAILTDSGGIQKEAYFHKTPCITLRDETEWVETVEAQWNCIVGADYTSIIEAAVCAKKGKADIEDFGTGNASMDIVNSLIHGLT